MSLKSYHEESLRPPATEDAAAAATTTKWDWAEVLLDHVAYMVDKKNHTSVNLQFKRDLDGKEVDLWVTLCFAWPPRLSYFCCHASCPNDKEEDTRLFFREPFVFATDDALAKGDACDAYRIAALAYDYFHDSSNSPYGPYYICTYDSKAEDWIRKPAAIPQPPLPSDYICDIDMVITIGGSSRGITESQLLPTTTSMILAIAHMAEDWIRKPAAIPQPPLPSDYICDIDMVITIGGSSRGIMGWVDLWNGMLLSDVLADHKPCRPLRYVTLPKPTQPQNWLPLAVDIGCNCRDIVLVKETGIIRFVDLQVHADPSIPCSQTPCGWTVLTWTLEGFHEGLDLETLGDLHFQPELELHSSDISGYKLPQSLFVSNPILSSNTDGVLYLRTNVSSATNRNSQVIAVDIKHKMLLDVKEFDMQRPNNYMRTSISSYLKPPVSNKSMKRRAPQSMGSSRKKPQQQPAITNPAEGGEVDVGDAMDSQ
ncbi:hypothetical protein TRIUR3_35284 [Triticum urartu]|uniref:Uncharacterized protein n=1 Tax=Triticum urartu TaxID=4572 RepID=M8A7A8_TRIUA|nr:hypothetical protein TRIUR3_35284 [Triticum urartu]